MDRERLKQIAAQTQKAFHQQGHLHMTVQAQRGHAIVKVDGEALARFTPGANDELHLGYRNHSGKWEPMPFVACGPDEAAKLALEVLAPHIQAFTEF